jgi:hypothetical protein
VVGSARHFEGDGEEWIRLAAVFGEKYQIRNSECDLNGEDPGGLVCYGIALLLCHSSEFETLRLHNAVGDDGRACGLAAGRNY